MDYLYSLDQTMIMHKKISSGYVPICQKCGKPLGVVCDDVDDMNNYIDNNGDICIVCRNQKQQFGGDTSAYRRVSHEEYFDNIQNVGEVTDDFDEFLRMLGNASVHSFATRINQRGGRFRRIKTETGFNAYITRNNGEVFVLCFVEKK